MLCTLGKYDAAVLKSGGHILSICVVKFERFSSRYRISMVARVCMRILLVFEYADMEEVYVALTRVGKLNGNK